VEVGRTKEERKTRARRTSRRPTAECQAPARQPRGFCHPGGDPGLAAIGPGSSPTRPCPRRRPMGRLPSAPTPGGGAAACTPTPGARPSTRAPGRPVGPRRPNESIARRSDPVILGGATKRTSDGNVGNDSAAAAAAAELAKPGNNKRRSRGRWC
jgi:hypothetical protein